MNCFGWNGVKRFRSLVVLLVAMGCGFAIQMSSAAADDATPLRLVKTVPLTGATGALEGLTVDTKRNRLYMTSPITNSLFVVDLAAGTLLPQVTGLFAPRDVLYLPEEDALLVSNLADGVCRLHDPVTYEIKKSYPTKPSVNYMRHDAAASRVYVGCAQSIATLDLKTGTYGEDMQLDERPEAFQFERNGNRLFVSLPDIGRVAVLDRTTRKTIAIWSLEDFTGNYAMAFDEANQRLFIGCRTPSRLVVLDAQTGARVAVLPLVGLCGHLFFNPILKCIYGSCGMGTVDVYRQDTPNSYKLLAREATSTAARTAHLDLANGRLYVPLPTWEGRPPELRIYETAARPSGTSSTVGSFMGTESTTLFRFDHLSATRNHPVGDGWKIEATKHEHAEATWEKTGDATAPSPPDVLSLVEAKHNSADRFNLCWTELAKLKDGAIKVSLKANKGETDQGGGPIWRVKDQNNYYVCRANPLEKNFRVYVVKDGERKQLASADADVPADKWHTINVTHFGDHIECWLNGKKLLDAHDSTLAEAGGVGVWTKADAASSFDDLTITPMRSK